ncbi:hypothetical protein [Brevundimonas aveniformis]|uniref:hypothetical protein n=1 Tax=Brevundimonas aveniformis TaxID=370977 RepID=UPI00042742E5|nr:hypothetical protein [Brevundimonas aveniformis]
MRNLAITTTFILATVLAGPASATATQETSGPVPEVTVERDGDVWQVEYELDRDAAVWAFIRSSLIYGSREPWRPDDWVVTTPGVVLERVGHLDILRTVDGGPVPRRVSLRITPRDHVLEADYGPLVFTDGSTALFTGAFEVFPLESVEAARALPEDLNGSDVGVENARITWRDRDGQVLIYGQRETEAVTEDGTTYALFGPAQMTQTERLVTVVDQALPEWVAASIESFAPAVAAYYAERLGPGQTDRPTIMAAWRGPTPELQSLSGSVLPGLIVMSFEGVGQVEATPECLATTHWFIGHESAHFWLGQTVRYERTRDSWITEGGADLMAIRALEALDPAFVSRDDLQGEVDDCSGLAVLPVSEAGRRGEHRAYYACGAVFALAAEAVQRRATGGDWFDFLRPLIDANREDGVLTRQEWLDHLTSISRDPSLASDIELLLDRGTPDPSAVIASLFERTGVAYRLDEGRVRLD